MQGNYFSQMYTLDNSSSAVEETFKVYAHKTGTFDTQTLDIFIPETPETRTFTDGNLTADGKQSYTWNGANRAIAFEKTDDYKVEAKYDYKGRRIEKKINSWTGATWQLDTTEKYVWAGWKLIGTFDASNTLKKSYCWGETGLLSVTFHATSKSYYACKDGNLNIVAYVDSSDGSVVAEYEYNVFGKIISKSGSMADDFVFRFASYQYDKTTGLIYYGYRYYDPETGRFINRDPIAEEGGLNLYANSRNDMANGWDYLGLEETGKKLNYIPSSIRLSASRQFFKDAKGNKQKDLNGKKGVFLISSTVDAGTNPLFPTQKKYMTHSNLGELIINVNTAIKEDECLEGLELLGHSNPSLFRLGSKKDKPDVSKTMKANILNSNNAEFFATALSKLKWCCLKKGKSNGLMLTGCNSGLSKSKKSYPQVLSNKTKVQITNGLKNAERNIEVIGTGGYNRGTFFEFNLTIQAKHSPIEFYKDTDEHNASKKDTIYLFHSDEDPIEKALP